jgi:hypothetical protein
MTEAYPVVMAGSRAATSRPRYEARPGRSALVIGDLAALRGPATGTVELPLRLAWGATRTFDLGDREVLRWMYQTVLREAVHEDELARFLDGDTLAAVWPELVLPKGVRRAWEDHHPALRLAAHAA